MNTEIENNRNNNLEGDVGVLVIASQGATGGTALSERKNNYDESVEKKQNYEVTSFYIIVIFIFVFTFIFIIVLFLLLFYLFFISVSG